MPRQKKLSPLRGGSLQDMSAYVIAQNFTRLKIDDVKLLPATVLQALYWKLSPVNLITLETALESSPSANQDVWMNFYKNTFPNYYRSLFKASQTNENIYCIVPKRDGDFRRAFMEDHFHALLEDANKLIILIQRGVLEVNLASTSSNGGKSNCGARLVEIKKEMFLCTPFVKSLKVSRSIGLMSPLLTDVLKALLDSVVCIRLVFLHDYRVLKDTVSFFMEHGKVKDFHTTWQPQRCSLQPRSSVEILTLLAGLQVYTGHYPRTITRFCHVQERMRLFIHRPEKCLPFHFAIEGIDTRGIQEGK